MVRSTEAGAFDQRAYYYGVLDYLAKLASLEQ